MTNTKHLFQEFESISTQQWIQTIEKALKGKSIDSLNWEVEKNLWTSPLHRADDTIPQQVVFADSKNNDWNICEEIFISTHIPCLQANETLLNALNNGANALIINLDVLPNATDLTILFNGVMLDLVSIHFKGNALYIAPFTFLQNLAQTPYAVKLQGSCDFGLISDSDTITCLDFCSANLPNLRPITICISDATTQSLSRALHTASLWIDKLSAKGKTIEQISNSLRFEFSIGVHYFLELASIRAFKRLWLALLEAYNPSSIHSPYLHATTKSDQNENQYWNMITATTQAMAAAIGGVHSLHVKPCNGIVADDFTRRIARNVQHLLQSESYFNRVIDPAAGSYYIENLTAALAQESWQQFCEL